MFHVGQLVVCVDNVPSGEHGLQMDGLTVGRVYSIRQANVFHPTKHTPHDVYLQEIVRPIRPGDGGVEVPYLGRRFRPLDESRLTIFRQMLVTPPSKELVDEDLDARIADCERAVREALGF